MRIKQAGLLLALFLATAAPGASRPEWKTFISTIYGYTVRYPTSWYLFTNALRPKLDYLDILNFPPSQRAEGVVLKDSGAEITVGRAGLEVKSVEQWIKESTKFETQVRQREIKNFTKSPSGCRELTEITSLSEVGPERNFSGTTYYCSTEHGLFAVSLTNWDGDPNQRNLRDIALKIAKSLRTR